MCSRQRAEQRREDEGRLERDGGRRHVKDHIPLCNLETVKLDLHLGAVEGEEGQDGGGGGADEEREDAALDAAGLE